jgi:LETM1-like, RBD
MFRTLTRGVYLYQVRGSSALVMRPPSVPVKMRSHRAPLFVYTRSYCSSSSSSSPQPKQNTPEEEESTISIASVRASMSAIGSGCKRLYTDWAFARRVRKRLAADASERITRRELHIVQRSAADLRASMPWVVLFMVPFIGYAVPLVALLRPRLLPEPLWSDAQRVRFRGEDDRLRRIASQQLLDQHPALADGRALDIDHGASASATTTTTTTTLSAWPSELLTATRVALLLARPAPRWLGGPASEVEHVAYQMDELVADDELLRQEGVAPLEELELESACYHRGLSPASAHALQKWLKRTAHLADTQQQSRYLCALLHQCSEGEERERGQEAPAA